VHSRLDHPCGVNPTDTALVNQTLASLPSKPHPPAAVHPPAAAILPGSIAASSQSCVLLLPIAALLAAALLLLLARSDADANGSAGSTPVTAYDELCLRGFPRGLLWANTNIRGYTLDASSGDFTIYLVSSCRIVSIPSHGGAVVAGEERSTLIFTRSRRLDF
jgi:hypothetical protein